MVKNNATMKEGKGKFINRKSRAGAKEYDSFFIYVPTEVARDTAYPFKEGDEVKIEIINGKIIIEKWKE